MNIGLIKFIITHNELPPFTELGRQKTTNLFSSIDFMIETTTASNYKTSKNYEFNCCKYHITILCYDLMHQNILFKLRYNSYKEYCENIRNDFKIASNNL